MARSTARVTRALMAAGGIALVCAGTATAATFKNDSGKLAASSVSGVTASGGTLKFTGTAKPTATPKFAGQIDFASGQATGLKTGGKLVLNHSGHSATLTVTKISGTTLQAKLGSTSLTFPLSLSKAKSTPNSTFTGVSVTGVVVKLSSGDAKALNSALKTSAYKSGNKFGTLSYSGIDRELIETSSGGPLTLCDDKSFDTQNAANGVVASPVSPATLTTMPCTGANKDGVGLDFPEAGKALGFIDTATGTGRITVKGGIKDTQGSGSSAQTGEFTAPIFELAGSNSQLSAVVSGNGVSLGRVTVANVAITATPSLKITESGGTFKIPQGGTTVKLNNTGASLLTASFCNSSNSDCAAGGTYSAGEAIGYSGGTTKFK